MRPVGRPPSSAPSVDSEPHPRRRSSRPDSAELRDQGVEAVAMEVSSHALAEHRVDALAFAAATFTNLSQDHLDYHPNMTAYFEAKARLFEPERSSMAIVNRDDQWGRRLIQDLEKVDAAVFTFSLEDITGLRIGPDGSQWQWGGMELRLHLAGRFNVANALAAASTRPRPRVLRRQHRRGTGRPALGQGPLRINRRRTALHRARRLRPHSRWPRKGPARRPRARPPGGSSSSSAAAGTGTVRSGR